MGNRLRTAVIGVGYLGKHHARILKESPHSELVAIVDADPKALAQFSERYQCQGIADYRELKGKVDAATVAVPTIMHYEIASWLLENGIHTLVEKPICYTVKEAESLVKLANKRKMTLAVGHIERFNPILRTLRNELDQVAFIEAHRLSSYPFRSTDVGVVMDVMIHDLDIILDLVDSPVEEIRANATPVISREHEDIAAARIQFKSGAVANITASRISDKVARKMRMFCPSKYVNIDFAARQAWIYTKSPKFDDPSFDAAKVDVRGVDNLMQFVFKNLINVKQLAISGEEEPLKAELESFLSAIDTGQAPAVTGEDGVRAIALAHDILAECRRHEQRYGRLADLKQE